ncbi:MAG: NTP transferase domain-containing protein [Ruminiclostridium sp.]|nr:NTP transferase domain-containing protein [Ruminiclostridium sp.]
MKITAVILAGGRGERFWPKSRTDCPKQFLSLTSDGETMIRKTVNRLSELTDAEDTFIVTNEKYLHLVYEQLPMIPKENVIAEPAARNTAPCIGLAAGIIQKKYGEDAVMLVLPSDHLIKFNAMFVDTLRQAVSVAEDNANLVTIGITPTYPETGYGYINFAANEYVNGAYKVISFVEKPNMEKAKEYVSSGEYLWNSGMFVWKASSILYNIRKHIPEMYEGLAKIFDTFGDSGFVKILNQEYPLLKSESIDFGVMEKAENIYTIPGNFGWDDVGSWLALERINPTNDYGNMITGDVVSVETKNTTVIGGKKLIATVGLDNIVVVDTDDAILICAKDKTQDVKKVIENLKICNRSTLL